MDNIEFNAHLSSVISLLRTLVIKCEAIGERDNQILAESGYPVTSNRREWRYYLNMNGEYHPTDEPMYITSLDNGEEILFSKASLETHLATLRAYQPGEYWYRRLTDRFPHQVELINGIIDPIDIDYAINAEDYKILRHNSNLIQRNEDQLINRTQQWIYAFVDKALRWNDYIYTDKLMLPVMWGCLHALLVPTIMIIRFEAIGTRYVNDHYVWSKLNSYGDFDPYRKFLNTEQKLWLYRNIEWVSRNTGQQFTMDNLIQHLLTNASIPLSHYEAILDTRDILTDSIPTGMFKRNSVNFKDRTQNDYTFLSVEQLLLKEVPLARDNGKEQEYLEVEMKDTLNYSTYSSMSSKVLESSMEDYTNRHADTLMKTLLHEWIYLSKHKRYRAIIDLTNPLTGDEFRMDTTDALVLWQYLLTRSRGESTGVIQPFYYQSVMRMKVPDLQVFLDAGGREYLPEYLCRDIRKLWVPSPQIISPDAFFDFCFEVYQTIWKTKKVYGKYMDIYRHARTKEATNRLFERGEAYLHDTTLPTYDEWLKNKELNFDLFSKEDCVLLAWDIFQKATAWGTKANVSVRQTQKNLIELMQSLGSYTVQFITDIDDGNRTIEANSRIDLSPSKRQGMSNVGDQLLPLQLPNELHVLTKASLNGKLKYDHKGANGLRGSMRGVGKGSSVLDLRIVDRPSGTHKPIACLETSLTLKDR